NHLAPGARVGRYLRAVMLHEARQRFGSMLVCLVIDNDPACRLQEDKIDGAALNGGKKAAVCCEEMDWQLGESPFGAQGPLPDWGFLDHCNRFHGLIDAREAAVQFPQKAAGK